MTVNAMTQKLVFKDSFSGTAKQTGRPFSKITLHDPSTLENSDFFLQPGVTIDTKGFKLGDPVLAEYGPVNRNGRMELTLVSLKHDI